MNIYSGYFIAFMLIFSSAAYAKTNGGYGGLNMTGSIIETACSLEMNNLDQSIDIGNLPMASVAGEAHTNEKEFVIRLSDCEIHHADASKPDWQFFRMTFDGQNDNGLFALYGNARGIGIEVRDTNGNVIHPGQPLPAQNLKPGEMRLVYEIAIVSDSRELVAGDYHGVIKYKIDYY